MEPQGPYVVTWYWNKADGEHSGEKRYRTLTQAYADFFEKLESKRSGEARRHPTITRVTLNVGVGA